MQPPIVAEIVFTLEEFSIMGNMGKPSHFLSQRSLPVHRLDTAKQSNEIAIYER